jgi:spheroidene monooxygenase
VLTPSATPGARSPAPPLGDEVVVLLLADVAARWRLWGWWRIMRGAQSFRRVPGLRFAKALGSGFEGGFGLRPSRSRQGVFAVFASEAAADEFIAGSSTLAAFRARSSELCIAKLRAWSSRGAWSGQTLHPSAAMPGAGQGDVPVAALTRASIQPRRALAFWRKAPPAQASLVHAPGCWLAVGLGEAPLLRQATFSVWESVAAMDAYARSGAHLEAIRASQREGYFSASMFARFVPVALRGCWNGTAYDPL